MKRILSFVCLFFLFVASALAVDVAVQHDNFGRGDVVIAQVLHCAGASTLKISNPASPPDLVYVDAGNGDWESHYNTNSNAFKGKYTISVKCQDSTKSTAPFCVDSPLCLGPVIEGDVDVPSDDSADDSSNSGSGGGGGGVRNCFPKYQCDNYWSVCSSNLVQTKNCVDTSPTKCGGSKPQTRACTPCRESWACSGWGECVSGSEARTCSDDLDCGSAAYKPVESRACGSTDVYGPEPARITGQVPPPSANSAKYPAVQKATLPAAEESFWDAWGLVILGIVAVLLLVGLVLFLLHRKKGGHAAYNYNELKEWVVKERAAGSKDADIRTILLEQTGWTKEDVELAFADLPSSAITLVKDGSPSSVEVKSVPENKSIPDNKSGSLKK